MQNTGYKLVSGTPKAAVLGAIGPYILLCRVFPMQMGGHGCLLGPVPESQLGSRCLWLC